MKKFVVLTALLFISRGFDIYTTFLYIPDLNGETNILVSVFGLGWKATVLVQLAVLLFLTYCLKVYSFDRVDLGKVGGQLTLTQFISQFHFRRPDQFKQLLYRFPDNTPSMYYALGGIVPRGLIVIGLIVGISTSALLISETYQSFYINWNVPVWLYASMVVIMFTSTVSFYRQERKKAIVK